MTLGLSGKDKRVLILTLVFVLMLVGGARVTARIVAWSSAARASAAVLDAAVTQQEASIRALPRTRDSLVARRVRLANMDSTILSGDTPALAGASLAELMSDLADATTAQIGNIQVRTDSSTHDTIVPVQVQASLTGDFSAISRFLARLEGGAKLLALRELAISVQSDQSGVQAVREALRADVVVEGLARNPTPRGGGKQ